MEIYIFNLQYGLKEVIQRNAQFQVLKLEYETIYILHLKRKLPKH